MNGSWPHQVASGQRFGRLCNAQHGVVARRQLLALGFSAEAIRHRVLTGRLHLAGRGVYAVGRPSLTREGRWMAAVLACGPKAALSHESAAALWGIHDREPRGIEVSVPTAGNRRRPGVVVHRRSGPLGADFTRLRGIPVTTLIRTLMDLALRLPCAVEAAINEATRRELTDPEALRSDLDGLNGVPGASLLRETLDRRTFVLTDSELERRFLRLSRAAGLPLPQTARMLNGFKVDFYWPDLGLVVETDGLRYHRTAAQQARDRLRDQIHTMAGLTALRFTHGQIRYEAERVERTLAAVARRIQG